MRGHGVSCIAQCGFGQAVSSWEDGRERLGTIRRRKFPDQMGYHQLCGVTSCGPVGLGSVGHVCGLPSLIPCEETCVVAAQSTVAVLMGRLVQQQAGRAETAVLQGRSWTEGRK
jgi:hypothetical protein